MAIFSALGSLAGGAIAKKGADSAAGSIEAAAGDASERFGPYSSLGEQSAPWLGDTFFDEESKAPVHGQLGAERVGAEGNPFSVDSLSEGFETSPGYQFRMDEGLKALDNSASAKGGLLSGANIKARERYAQGVASEDYWNFVNKQSEGMTKDYGQRADAWNRGFGLAGMGFQSVNSQSNLEVNAASKAGGLRAQGAAAFGKGVSGALGSLGKLVKPGGGIGGAVGGAGINSVFN